MFKRTIEQADNQTAKQSKQSVMKNDGNNNITILCRIVDNFGDIGFVWRLTKNLAKTNPSLKIRLVASDLAVFKKLVPQIEASLAEQEFLGIKIFDWNSSVACKNEFTKNPPQIILECFQCGRPDWLEEILFAEDCGAGVGETHGGGAGNSPCGGASNPANENIVQIINIDYLTAEPYAEEFHRLKSGTRKANVKKVNFMPGFTAKTGGLILDEPFVSNWQRASAACSSQTSRPTRPTQSIEQKILLFAYKRDMSPIFRAIKKYSGTLADNKKINLLLAHGIEAPDWTKTADTPDPSHISRLPPAANSARIFATPLAFLPQAEWDAAMLSCDTLFVRGEDSLARACLCGKPFVWNAYPQDADHQLVKVRALLDRMSRHFSPDDFAVVERLWLLYNGAQADAEFFLEAPFGSSATFCCATTQTLAHRAKTNDIPSGLQDTARLLENACLEFLQRADRLQQGFSQFSESLFALGDFTKTLDDFIGSIPK